MKSLPKIVRAPLYQLYVETRSGTPLAIGPKAPAEFLEPLLVHINGTISAGKEREWSNPTLVPTTSLL